MASKLVDIQSAKKPYRDRFHICHKTPRPGQTVTSFCRQEGLSRSTYYRYLKFTKEVATNKQTARIPKDKCPCCSQDAEFQLDEDQEWQCHCQTCGSTTYFGSDWVEHQGVLFIYLGSRSGCPGGDSASRDQGGGSQCNREVLQEGGTSICESERSEDAFWYNRL